MVPGVRVHGDTVVDVEVSINEQFRSVPLTSKLGLPVMFKEMPGTGGDDSKIRSNIIVRFMADPDDGFAPPEWQYGGGRGPAPPVVLARKDGIPFSKQDWDALGDYLEEWRDECNEAEENRLQVSERILKLDAFRSHVMGQRDARPTAFLSLQFPLGCTVVAEGLSIAELNGLEGEVVRYSRDRVGIQFPGRAVTALKPERLRLVREAPQPAEPAAKRQDTGEEKVVRQRHLEHLEAKAIAKRFVECLHEDTFPEMGDLHLFGVGCEYHARAQDVLAVWQGSVKHMELSMEELAGALENGTMKEFFVKTCQRLAASKTPNSTYANELIKNNYAALEWDTL